MERFIPNRSGLRLWTESFGDPAGPTVLLIAGGAAQGIVWPDLLCRLFVAAGYHVVRYDHRDTGRSAKSEQDYEIGELAADAADVITGRGLRPVHVVAQSLGGVAAQLLALDRPELVRSLVLLSTSPDPARHSGLPGQLAPMLDWTAATAADPPTTPQQRIESALACWRVLVGPGAPFDEPYWRTLVERAEQRAAAPSTTFRHLRALDRAPSLLPRLPAVAAPVLVVHGHHDPVFPLPHGRALHRAVPHARLAEIAGLGHHFPPQWSELIHRLVLDHLRGLD
ncbi:alpha/beta fold hydrolase [Kitasatospora sp. NPDC092948]|uniref:alpha/beta fold hydrolase n=1 Tax=Kitasatospora sp. NPDC092948 TaxID=3364088 RepID=UPI0038178D03